VAAFVLIGAALLPLATFWLCAALNGSAGSARRLAFSLVPLGVSMWAAHLLFHAASVFTTSSVAWLEVLLLEAGLLFALYTAWRIAEEIAPGRSLLRLFSPWAGVACLLFAAGVWVFFQPMQMRGMVH
jgi:hypothetical protein